VAKQFAEQFGLDKNLFVSQIDEESGFDPDAESGAGARGIAQFMPDTAAMVARQLGVSLDDFWADPKLQLKGAARHMHDLLEMFDGDIAAALVAYNAGPGGAQAWLAHGKDLGWLEDNYSESRKYLRDILGLASGGIVFPRPGGTPAILGEGGRPEAVIPLPRDWQGGGIGGGNTVISLTLQVANPLASPRQIADAVVPAIEHAVKTRRLSPAILGGG
jgi:hypothetical protein